MSFTSWVTRMWIHLQDLGQTLRVLLNNYLHPHHVLNPCVSSHCLFKLQLKLSHQPQVQLYSRKTSPNLKNPWVLNLTSNYNNKWVHFQASMLEAMKSLWDEFQYFKKTSKREVDQTSSSASKPGTSKQPENLDPTPPRTQSWADEAMDVDLYGPPLPPHLGDKQSIQDSDPRHHLGDQQSIHESDPRHVSDEHSGQSEEPSRVVSARPKKHADKRKHKFILRHWLLSKSAITWKILHLEYFVKIYFSPTFGLAIT